MRHNYTVRRAASDPPRDRSHPERVQTGYLYRYLHPCVYRGLPQYEVPVQGTRPPSISARFRTRHGPASTVARPPAGPVGRGASCGALGAMCGDELPFFETDDCGESACVWGRGRARGTRGTRDAAPARDAGTRATAPEPSVRRVHSRPLQALVFRVWCVVRV